MRILREWLTRGLKAPQDFASVSGIKNGPDFNVEPDEFVRDVQIDLDVGGEIRPPHFPAGRLHVDIR
jgi:hypothetical protein